MNQAILSHFIEEKIRGGEKSFRKETLQVSDRLGSRTQVC